jgi:flagellar biosynthesis protein FliP
MTSELKRAFRSAFYHIPFIIIDNGVASTLIGMGMKIAAARYDFPAFKVLLFVLVDVLAAHVRDNCAKFSVSGYNPEGYVLYGGIV